MISYLTVLTKDSLGKRRFQLQKGMDDLKYDIAQEQTASKKKAREVDVRLSDIIQDMSVVV